MIKKYSHIPDKIHGALFTHFIERIVPGAKDFAIYRFTRYTLLWLTRIVGFAVMLGLSVFLIWLWLVKVIVLGGSWDKNQSEGLIDLDEEEKQLNLEDHGAYIINGQSRNSRD